MTTLSNSATLFFLFVLLSTVGAQDSPETQIDRLFERYGTATPGAAVAVLKEGRLVFSKGYGIADLEHGVPIDPALTRFNLASVSKQFTAFALQLLIEDGKLSLTDEVRRYLPELTDFGTPLTIRHLVSNTSGVRDDLTLFGMKGYTNDNLITQEMVKNIAFRQRGLNFVPGDKFSYSNSNFVLLAEIISRVSEQPFAEFIMERIFDPLGMKATFVMDNIHHLVPNRAFAYFFHEGKYWNDYIQTNVHGSSGIYTTVADMMRWAAHLENPRLGQPASLRAMETPIVLNDGSVSPYGMGFFIDEYRGLKRIQHSGATGSYRAFVARLPDQALTVVLLSNDAEIDLGNSAMRALDPWLAEVPNLKKEEEVTPVSDSTPEDAAPLFELTANELSRLNGTFYCEELDVTYRLNAADGELGVEHPGFGRISLEPVAAGVFSVNSWRFTSLEFASGNERYNEFRLSTGETKNLRFRRR